MNKHLTKSNKLNPVFINKATMLSFCAAVVMSGFVQGAPDGSALLQENETLPTVVEIPDSELPLPPEAPEDIEQEPENAIKVLISDITFKGVTVFPVSTLDEQVSDELNIKHSFTSLKRIAAQISGLYQEAGYMMAQVYLPQQNLKNGKLQININEGLIGEINIEQQGKLKSFITEKHLISLKGTVINSAILERKTRLLSDLPANEVSIVFEPSLKEGYTDMIVTTTDVKAGLGYLSLDNHGNRYIGSTRLSGQYIFNNKLGYGEKISLNGVSSGAGYSNISIKSQLPIGGNGLLLDSEITFNQYQLGESFSALEAHGRSRSVSSALFYPLIRSLNKNINIRAQLKQQNFTDEVDSVNSSTTKRLDSLNIKFSGDYAELFGDTTYWGLGLSTGYVDLDDSQKSIDSYDTDGQYTLLTGNLERLYRLNDKWSVHMSAALQIAAANLDSAVKMQLGGSSAVRAYPQGEASVDSGAIANIEFNYQKNDELVLGLFWDVGFGKEHQNELNTDTDNSKHISGVGLKFDWNLAENWRLKSSIAWRTGDKPESDTRDNKPRFWLQLVRYL